MALRAYVPGVRLERPPRSGRAPTLRAFVASLLRSARARARCGVRPDAATGRVADGSSGARCSYGVVSERKGKGEVDGSREVSHLLEPFGLFRISRAFSDCYLFLWIQRIQRIRSISMVLGYAADGNLCFHCTPHWDHATHTLGTLRTTTRRVRRENGKRRAYPNAEVGHAPRRLRSWMRHTAACGVPQPRHVAQCT